MYPRPINSHQQPDQHPGNISNPSPQREKKQKNRRFKTYKTTTQEKTIYNLSTRTLNEHHKSVLDKGLSFVPTPTNYNHIHTIRDTLLFNRRVRLKHFFDQSNQTETPNSIIPTESKGWTPPPGITDYIDTYTNYILHHMSCPPKQINISPNITPEEIDALRELQADENIIIQKADKGGAIVILDTTDYIKEANRQLSNIDHYTQTPHDTTLERTKNIRTTLTTMENDHELPEQSSKRLIPPKVRTSPFYMLPKIHKMNNPGRPIVSGIDSPTDRISGTLDRILKPILKHIPSYVKDTKHFVNIIHESDYLHEDEFLVTIDVSSLYTSMD